MIIKTKNYFTMNLLWNIKSLKPRLKRDFALLGDYKKFCSFARNVFIISYLSCPVVRSVGTVAPLLTIYRIQMK